MKSLLRTSQKILATLITLSPAWGSSSVDFREIDNPDKPEAKMLVVTMQGVLANQKSWSASPLHLACQEKPEHEKTLRTLYANQDDATFMKTLASLKERSSVRFGQGNPHGILLVQDGDGLCIGHAVIGQHFGFKGVAVPYFYFSSAAWQQEYPQAVAHAYFAQWVPKILERGSTCFTGPKASDQWATDGRLQHMFMLSPLDHTQEHAMMDAEGFGVFSKWNDQTIPSMVTPLNDINPDQIIPSLQGLLNNQIDPYKESAWNITINGTQRTVIHVPGLGLRYFFYKKIDQPQDNQSR